MEVKRIVTLLLVVFILASVAFGALGDMEVKALKITVTGTPSASNATGTTGAVLWDSDYIYICVATNTWMRAPLDSWAAVVEFVLLESGDFLLLENGDKLIKD